LNNLLVSQYVNLATCVLCGLLFSMNIKQVEVILSYAFLADILAMTHSFLPSRIKS